MNWRASPWFGVVSTVFTGVLFLVSLDVGPWGPLALLAPVPLLIYALCAPRAITVALAAAGARAIGLAASSMSMTTSRWRRCWRSWRRFR